MSRIILVHWNAAEAEERAGRLRELGHEVTAMTRQDLATMQALRDAPPDAVVIDLARLSSQGRDLGVWLRGKRTTRGVPLVFVGGEPEKLQHPDLQVQIERLLAGLRASLDAELIGVYLHGSAAMGCFNPRRSDVDLLAVTRTRIGTGARHTVMTLLLEVSGDPYPIEISTLTWDDLHPWRYPTPYDLHYSETWRRRLIEELREDLPAPKVDATRTDPDLAAHIAVTRGRGICLWGAAIAAVFPEPPREDVIASLRQDVLSDVYGLRSDLADPVYVVLNACRTYAYLRTGAILSKEEGGRLALTWLPRSLTATVTWALASYRDEDVPPRPSREALAEFAHQMSQLLAWR